MAKPTYEELVDALARVVENLNWARLVMDQQGRQIAGELVRDYRDLVERARAVRYEVRYEPMVHVVPEEAPEAE